jgi:hypothetical protein
MQFRYAYTAIVNMPADPTFRPHGGRQRPTLGAGPAPDGRPGSGGNVLLITADQFRASALSCSGGPAVVRTSTLRLLTHWHWRGVPGGSGPLSTPSRAPWILSR